jgi:hypothetical protein
LLTGSLANNSGHHTGDEDSDEGGFHEKEGVGEEDEVEKDADGGGDDGSDL